MAGMAKWFMKGCDDATTGKPATPPPLTLAERRQIRERGKATTTRATAYWRGYGVGERERQMRERAQQG